MGTTCPGLTLMDAIVPAAGAGISTVALSVITSTTGWCSATVSPSFTSHFTISPSAMPSPMSGSLKARVPPPPRGSAALGSGFDAAGCAGACVGRAPCDEGSGAGGDAFAFAAAGSGALALDAGCAFGFPFEPVSSTNSTWPTGTTSPSFGAQLGDAARLRSGDLDRGLVGHDLDHGWCSLTWSPTFTSHFTISPSAIPSPMSGSLNSSAMGCRVGRCAAASRRTQGQNRATCSMASSTRRWSGR
jgi:hypothetical protein